MTTAHPQAPTDLTTFDAVLADITAHAAAVDAAEEPARRILPSLGALGLLDQDLPRQIDTVATIASACVSSAFTVWAQRMTIAYLRYAATPVATAFADELAHGSRPGVTGMASAFKESVGAGSLDVTAHGTEQGIILEGTLRWASNLYPDAIAVTAARAHNIDGIPDGQGVIVVCELDRPGVNISSPFSLLGLNATASSSLTFDRVVIPHSHLIVDDSRRLCTQIRPTFVALQTALCVGLASGCLEGIASRITAPLNTVFADDFDAITAAIESLKTRLAAAAQGRLSRQELLHLRLDAAEGATRAAGLEVRVSGGAGYAQRSAASRRFREASFIPVQSPSEAQLRWELAQLEGQVAA